VWLYAAVEPSTGASFCLDLPRLAGACLEVFLNALRHADPEARIVLVLEGSGSHGKAAPRWPAGIQPLRLPPYSPELNPAERCFEELRAALANTGFESTDVLMAALTRELEPYWAQPARLAQLTGYPRWLKGIANIRTLA
jgi:transposase